MTGWPPTGDADRWLILDVDDTLVETYRMGFAKCREAARSLGLEPPSQAAFGELYGSMTFDECVRRLHPGVDVVRYQASYDALAARYSAQPLCDGPALAAAMTEAGLRSGILTNGPAAKTARKLRACGLEAKAFDFVVSGDTAATRKPEVAAFAALSGYGVDPRLAWYVSDSAVEWRAAEAAGFRSAGIPAGHQAGRGYLPMLLLPSALRLPEVVPILAASAGSPRPGSPSAVTFDAGFTLIEPVQDPADIIRVHMAHTPPVPPAYVVRSALAAAAGALASPQSWWASTAAAESVLRCFYAEVLANLGCRCENAAEAVISAYVGADNWRPRPGAADLLAAARASGRKVGVLSNWQTSLAEILARTGLDRHIDAVVVSTLAGVAKPSRAAFRAAANALGVGVERVVHVGDQLVDDALGALRAGGRAVVVDGPLDELAGYFLSAPA